MKLQFLIALLFPLSLFAQKNIVYQSIDKALKNPLEVYELYLDGKDFTYIPKEITQFKNLEKLSIVNA